jgi:hypothetical protein
MFLVWMLVATGICSVVTQLVPSSVRPVILAVLVATATLFGVVRCHGLHLTVSSEGVRFQNLFRAHELRTAAITNVTLRRFGSNVAVTQERVSRLPLIATLYGIRFPAIAFGGPYGRISPPVSFSAFVGRSTRQSLLTLLTDWASSHRVRLDISLTNRGWLGGVSWDIRQGYGVVPDDTGTLPGLADSPDSQQ